ncbi:hypothetical protein F5J12DRAFT_785755 [Pisolithus orientalis]|uniref:uncharacterized protein n=1 Tax=Pisolithus orientalis TaxID=936130 RepID=UPI00222459BA|nr:uncharacterized protein F5J12DRAFT_785755 [Pisolithus orientalis]KAI5994558.1 hypothetical protein F5J12DRAFT_785755 [Pisolithus orientalis]
MQITLPVVQEVMGLIPITGAGLKAAISGFLAVLKDIDQHAQNKAGLSALTCLLYDLSCHLINAPTAWTPSETAGSHPKWTLKLWSMQQDGNTTCYLISVTPSIDWLPFLPSILNQCQPDEAQIQQWYINRGQYDFMINNGMNITKLIRECDAWTAIQPGTKIVMRVIMEEVVRMFSARCQCCCGTGNKLEVDMATVLNAFKNGWAMTWYLVSFYSMAGAYDGLEATTASDNFRL